MIIDVYNFKIYHVINILISDNIQTLMDAT